LSPLEPATTTEAGENEQLDDNEEQRISEPINHQLTDEIGKHFRDFRSFLAHFNNFFNISCDITMRVSHFHTGIEILQIDTGATKTIRLLGLNSCTRAYVP